MPDQGRRVACVAGVKSGRERGNLGARGRKERKGKVPLLPPPSRVVPRPKSLPLPFQTPATQARKRKAKQSEILGGGSRRLLCARSCVLKSH